MWILWRVLHKKMTKEYTVFIVLLKLVVRNFGKIVVLPVFILLRRRVNVALTRAKNHLFILGSQKHLTQNDLWSKVIMYCAGKSDSLLSLFYLGTCI